MESPSLRIVVVTGASRGIGRAIALSFADSKHLVYVNYRSRADEAEKVCKEIADRGGNAEALGFDVADSAQVEKAFATIAEKWGGVDVVVSNAGISIDSLLLRSKDEDFEKVVQTNLKGAFSVTRSAMKTMLRRKNDGRIVYLTSVVGQMGNAGQAVYSASKAGIRGFMKSIAREVASRSITVNSVAPGFVRTDMTDALTDAQKSDLLKKIPLGRYAEPEDIANVVRFLASSEASYITGQEIAVNGGMYL